MIDRLASVAGVVPNQVKFCLSHIALIPIAVLYRTKLSPLTTSPTVRHVAGGAIGLAVILFIFGCSTVHMVSQAVGAYLILYLTPKDVAYKLAFIYTMAYMTLVHLSRILSVDNITTFYVSYTFDGTKSNDEKCVKMQRLHMLRKLPSLTEYFGYVFNFAGIFAGPGYFYKDYMAFITGEHVKTETHHLQNEQNGTNKASNGFHSLNRNHHREKLNKSSPCATAPDPFFEVVKKIGIALGCLLVHIYLSVPNPVSLAEEETFIASHGFGYRMLYICTANTFYYFKYFFHWIFAEAIHNAAGLGLHYVDGKPNWDLTCNVRINKVLFSSNPKEMIDNWNIFTMKWLRYICYEREIKYKVLALYTLNSLWHGLEFGLFVSFFGLAIISEAARKVRRGIRPHFVGSRWHPLYNVATRIGTQIALTLTFAGFPVRHFWPTLRIYTFSMYWSVFIIAVIIIALPVPRNAARHDQNSNTIKVSLKTE